MRRASILVSFIASLIIALSLVSIKTAVRANKSSVVGADDLEVITATVGGEGSTWRLVWHIDKPKVAERLTEYRQISLFPGDRITIASGGCVQTGGHGKTWKRYFNPQGPNSDRFYHGLIWIPGAIGALGAQPDLKRLMDINRSFVLASNFSPTFLRLGYEDDDYSDNGYWGHDDGTGDQCKGVGNAFLTVTIERTLPAGTRMIRGFPFPQVEPGYALRLESVGLVAVWHAGAITGRFSGYCNDAIVRSGSFTAIPSSDPRLHIAGVLNLECHGCGRSACITSPIFIK